ncbi:hypothetical protein MTO96_022707 [Rhipicephalus appendiculatus]
MGPRRRWSWWNRCGRAEPTCLTASDRSDPSTSCKPFGTRKVKRVVVTKHKGTYLKFMGAKNQLLLMRDGTLMSLSEGYELLLKDGDDYDKYLVYSHILRAGYIVVPHRKQRKLRKRKAKSHESDDDVVCLDDDSDDSDISVVEVIPAKFPKLDPSITITAATSPKRSLFPDKRRSRGNDLAFPQYVAGQPLVLKRPPRHLLPRNVYPSREWEKRRNRGWYGERSSANWDQRHSSGRRNPAIPDLRPDLQCQGNGQAWQAPDMSSWHAPNSSAPMAPEQRRDGRTWSNHANSTGYGTGQSRGPYQGGDGPWNNTAARPAPYDASPCQPWWHEGGGLPPPQPWNFADARGAASMERPPIPLPWVPATSTDTLRRPTRPKRRSGARSHGGSGQTRHSTPDRVGRTGPLGRTRRRTEELCTGMTAVPAETGNEDHTDQATGSAVLAAAPTRTSILRPCLPFSAEATSWSELKSGLSQTERTEALLGGEGSILWKGSIEPLVTPTQDVSIPGIVSQLAIIQEVDLVNGSRQSNGSTSNGSEPVTPDLDVYLPATSYSKRKPWNSRVQSLRS